MRLAPFFLSVFGLRASMSECFSETGLRFACRQCSHCCRHEPGFVYVSARDLSRLCRYFSLCRADFISTYCRWVEYYDGTHVLCLKEKPGYDCILWDCGCTAYEARPVQCSTYPFWTHIVANKRSWEQEALSCPGINEGAVHTWQEIEQKRRLYETNTPLRRGEE